MALYIQIENKLKRDRRAGPHLSQDQVKLGFFDLILLWASLFFTKDPLVSDHYPYGWNLFNKGLD